MKITVSARWNITRSAVEIREIKGYSFLGLPQEIRAALLLTYTDDGFVLSAAAPGFTSPRFRDTKEWVQAAEVNLGARVVSWHPDPESSPDIDVMLELNIPTTASTRTIQKNKAGWIAAMGGREWGGFATRLQAERFINRIWRTSTGIYFIDHDDDGAIVTWIQEEFADRSKLQHWAISKGYGDMRWSITHQSGRGDDSCYIDFYPLPEWCGKKFAVQSVIDSETGSYCADLSVDVVTAEELTDALTETLDSIQEWFDENGGIMDVLKQIRKVRVELMDEALKSKHGND